MLLRIPLCLFNQIDNKICYKIKFPDVNEFNIAAIMQTGVNYEFDMYTTSYDEFFSLAEFFRRRINKRKINIVDLGGGIGRSSVFFYHLNKWKNNRIYIVDKSVDLKELRSHLKNDVVVCEGQHTNFHESPDINNSAYNNEELVGMFTKMNGVNNIDFIDYNDYCRDDSLGFDLLYSFQSVGYHYSILDAVNKLKLATKARLGAYLIFGVRKTYRRNLPENYNIDYDIGSRFKLISIIPGKCRQDFIIFKKI